MNDPTITYVDHDGNEQTGVVWSPGPVASSLWVLPYSGAASSEAIVVKLPTGARPHNHAVAWSLDSEIERRHGAYYARNYLSRDPAALADALLSVYSDMSHAPELAPKHWRAATAGAQQLALVSA